MTCNTNRIAGCSFGLYPMTSQFVEVILAAISEVDITKVWSRTDDLETCVRGQIPHIFDVTQAMFLHSASKGHHVVFRGTFSIGCPGDSAGDTYMATDTQKLNESLLGDFSMPIAGKFSIYPLGNSPTSNGSDGYMGQIYQCISQMKSSSLNVRQIHYATRFDGDARLAWKHLEQCFQMLEDAGSKHTVMDVCISGNSPTLEQP